MFTGIVQASLAITAESFENGIKHIEIALPPHMVEGLQIGASVAVEGVCLTVTAIEENVAHFDIIEQSLNVTTLSKLAPGVLVNVERSARYGDEVGGHIVSGHVDVVAEVVDIIENQDNREVWYRLPAKLHKYVFERGFIALNGCSLTVAKVNEYHDFAVCYIPETLKVTTHGASKIGDGVNLEIDRQTQAIVDTVERTLAAKTVS